MVFSIDKALDHLDWHRSTASEDGYRQSYEWFAAGGRDRYEFDFSADDAVLARAQSSSGHGVNRADAGEAPAMASAASTTAAAVYEVCSSKGKRTAPASSVVDEPGPVRPVVATVGAPGPPQEVGRRVEVADGGVGQAHSAVSEAVTHGSSLTQRMPSPPWRRCPSPRPGGPWRPRR